MIRIESIKVTWNETPNFSRNAQIGIDMQARMNRAAQMSQISGFFTLYFAFLIRFRYRNCFANMRVLRIAKSYVD